MNHRPKGTFGVTRKTPTTDSRGADTVSGGRPKLSRHKLVLSLRTVTHLYTCNKKQPSPRWFVRELCIINFPVITTTFIHMCICSLDPSPPAKEATTTWLSCSCGGVWPCRHNLTCDIMVGPSCHINEAKEFLHTFGHSLGEAMEFLTDVFFESLPSLVPHLLDLTISVPIQRHCVRVTRRECVSIRPRGIPRSWV